MLLSANTVSNSGPFGLPLYGNLPQIRKQDILGYLDEVIERYGPVCKVRAKCTHAFVCHMVVIFDLSGMVDYRYGGELGRVLLLRTLARLGELTPQWQLGDRWFRIDDWALSSTTAYM